jgi:hypothetical protein
VSGLLNAFTPDHPAVPLAAAAAVVVVTLVILAVSLILRRRYDAVGTVVYARRPLVFVLCAPVFVVAVALPAFIRFDLDSISFLLLALLFGGGGFVQFAPTALRIWAAEPEGLTSQVIAWRRTFPWQTIDWAFVKTRRTGHTFNEIKLLESKDRFLLVEAGPSRRMKIPISTWLGGDATPLMRAIQERAANAFFGVEKQLEVERHRKRGVLAQ